MNRQTTIADISTCNSEYLILLEKNSFTSIPKKEGALARYLFIIKFGTICMLREKISNYNF
jgi:hypothetical protein